MKSNKMVIYNMNYSEFILIETTLSKIEVVKKALEFKKNGGRYESDFVDLLNLHGYAEILPVDGVDFNFLEDYLEE